MIRTATQYAARPPPPGAGLELMRPDPVAPEWYPGSRPLHPATNVVAWSY